MRFRVVMAVLLLAGCGGSPAGGTTGSSASCAGPTLAGAPASAAPGDTVHVTGDFFAATCNDTGVNGADPGRPVPLTDLTLQLRQGDRRWTLAEGVDASGERWSVDEVATVPADVAAGEAEVLVVGYGSPASVAVVPAS